MSFWQAICAVSRVIFKKRLPVNLLTMKKSIAALLVAATTGALLFSCDKNDNGSGKNVPLRLLLTDEPINYDSVNVHIKGVRIKLHDDNESWIDVASKDTTVNLLDLQNGVTTVLVNDTVPQGVLKEVRFILGNNSYVVVDGVRHELETPSAEHSGLKIKINRNLGEELNTFILDFDAGESIREQNGNYKLMPVIRLKD